MVPLVSSLSAPSALLPRANPSSAVALPLATFLMPRVLCASSGPALDGPQASTRVELFCPTCNPPPSTPLTPISVPPMVAASSTMPRCHASAACISRLARPGCWHLTHRHTCLLREARSLSSVSGYSSVLPPHACLGLRLVCQESFGVVGFVCPSAVRVVPFCVGCSVVRSFHCVFVLCLTRPPLTSSSSCRCDWALVWFWGAKVFPVDFGCWSALPLTLMSVSKWTCCLPVSVSPWSTMDFLPWLGRSSVAEFCEYCCSLCAAIVFRPMECHVEPVLLLECPTETFEDFSPCTAPTLTSLVCATCAVVILPVPVPPYTALWWLPVTIGLHGVPQEAYFLPITGVASLSGALTLLT